MGRLGQQCTAFSAAHYLSDLFLEYVFFEKNIFKEPRCFLEFKIRIRISIFEWIREGCQMPPCTFLQQLIIIYLLIFLGSYGEFDYFLQCLSGKLGDVNFKGECDSVETDQWSVITTWCHDVMSDVEFANYTQLRPPSARSWIFPPLSGADMGINSTLSLLSDISCAAPKT